MQFIFIIEENVLKYKHMKIILGRKNLMLLIVVMLFACVFSCYVQNYQKPLAQAQDVAAADAVTSDMLTISDDNFSATFSAFSRKNSALSSTGAVSAKILDNTRDVTYICYDWADIQYLHIVMTKTDTSSAKTYTTMRLVVSYAQTEDLTQNVGTGETVYNEAITTVNTNFNYYINEATIVDTTSQAFGDGFGIYKFELIYSYTEDQNGEPKTIEKTAGEIYFFIEPDDIDEIDTRLTLSYVVTSSNELLNTFNISFSTSAYNYVNPCHLVWTVEGTDIGNLKYVLTKADTEETGYQTYSYIWESLEERTGTSFVFDSNSIEGDFTVTCTIYDSNGIYKTSAVVNVTTIKEKTVSYTWLIIILCLLILIILLALALIYLMKKQEKLW